MFYQQIPTTPMRIRYVGRRFQPLVGLNRIHHEEDELATREANWLRIRYEPSWLKYRIRRSLGYKALGRAS